MLPLKKSTFPFLIGIALLSSLSGAQSIPQEIPDSDIEEKLTGPINVGTGSATLDKTTEVELPGAGGSTEQTGLYVNVGGSYTAKEGAALKITATGENGVGIQVKEIYSEEGQTNVSLGQVNVFSTKKGIEVGGRTENKQRFFDVSIGDNSWIKSEIAVSLTGRALNSDEFEATSKISIGNNALLSGDSFGSTVGALNVVNGGLLTIGSEAEIVNPGSNNSNSLAVIAYTRKEADGSMNSFLVSKINIGNNSQVKTLRNG